MSVEITGKYKLRISCSGFVSLHCILFFLKAVETFLKDWRKSE